MYVWKKIERMRYQAAKSSYFLEDGGSSYCGRDNASFYAIQNISVNSYNFHGVLRRKKSITSIEISYIIKKKQYR